MFIAFEGIDGSGKTSLIREVGKHLTLVAISEPTTSPPNGADWRWFAEDRDRHCDQVIGPALARGGLVLCDRYWWSTIAYQGSCGVPRILPDVTVYVDVPPSAAVMRCGLRGECEDEARLGRIRSRYVDLVSVSRNPVLFVDGLRRKNHNVGRVLRFIARNIKSR